MDFEKWLNKANEEISKRKEKDLKKEKKLKKNYDESIHKLYIAYQNHKNSKLLVIATIGLLIVTGIYALLVLQQNNMVHEQFISKNSPLFYISDLSGVSNGKELILDLTIQNIGEASGRILNINVTNDCGQELEMLEEFKQRTVLTPLEKKTFASLNYTLNPIKDGNLKLIINYVGVKESNRKILNYTEKLKIDKYGNIYTEEGDL